MRRGWGRDPGRRSKGLDQGGAARTDRKKQVQEVFRWQRAGPG